MEALTAASVAALTIYDMCKSAQKDIEITGICLLSKTGGKSGDYEKIAEGQAGVDILQKKKKMMRMRRGKKKMMMMMRMMKRANNRAGRRLFVTVYVAV